MRMITATALSVLALTLAACGGAGPTVDTEATEDPVSITTLPEPDEISVDRLSDEIGMYPRPARIAFEDACKQEAPPGQCQCALTYLQKNVSLADLMLASARVREDNLPKPLADAVAACGSGEGDE